MMIIEYAWHSWRKKSMELWRESTGTDGSQPLHSVNEKTGDFESLANGRTLFAQNDAYIEVSSDSWVNHGDSIGATLGMWCVLTLLWVAWYYFAIHPPLFGHFPFSDVPLKETKSMFWGVSLIASPVLGGGTIILWFMHKSGSNTWLFSQMRGRIRFNRVTRKVYVLRPENCGGNAVFDWDRLQVNLRHRKFAKRNTKPRPEGALSPLMAYHPPLEDGSGEDVIVFGGNFRDEASSSAYWEYIRRFMQSKPNGNDQALRDLVDMTDVFTFAGKPSRQHYRYESGCGWVISWLQMLSQATCYWPRFPKEWKSDSGMGEPEDDPVRAGALMTFFVYHQEGKLSEAQWEQGKKVGWVKADAKF